jgi:hypothetical protein
MKKIICYFAGICALYSVNVWAGNVPEITITGHPINTGVSLQGDMSAAQTRDAAMSTMTRYGTTINAEAHAAKLAAEKAAKEQARKTCLADSKAEESTCKSDADDERIQRVESCNAISDLEASIICVQDSNTHYYGRIKTCNENYTADKAWCEKIQ